MVKEYLQLASDCSAIWNGFQILLLARPGSKYPSYKFSCSLGHDWLMSVPSIPNHQVSSISRCGIGRSADDGNDRLLVRLRTKTSLDQQTCLQRTQPTALPGRERLGQGRLYLSRLLAMLAGYPRNLRQIRQTTLPLSRLSRCFFEPTKLCGLLF